jgi:hypothetical protein
MSKMYSEVEVIELLAKERQRAIDTAYSFMDKNKKQAGMYLSAGNQKGYVTRTEVADECRLVGNAISGLNALSAALGQTMRDRIKKQLTT